MGMYVVLSIHNSHLPDELKKYEEGWQTKSLNCAMDTIFIKEDGSLEILTYHGGYSKYPYTGEIRFYSYIEKEWTEFVAFFEKGQMFKLIQVL